MTTSDKPKPLSFPESDGPFVTITFVTRGRSYLLPQAVDSIYSLAAQREKLEFLFRADSDDLDTIAACSRLVQMLPNASLLVEPRGTGYVNMHHWVNRLVKLARGDWVTIWNDDAFMRTQDWDMLLRRAQVPLWHTCPDVAYIHISSIGRPHATEFFFVRRKVIDIMGHFFLSPHGDNWIYRVMSKLDSAVSTRSILVDHQSHLMEDQTRKDSVAAYADGALAIATLESEEAQKGIDDSVAKLRNHIMQYMDSAK